MQSQRSFTVRQAGVLYLVATPIGNLQDITLRALEVLKQVDWIACEDTRQSRKLLTRFNITTPFVSYHEHNRRERGAEILRWLEEGKEVALVSDAGLPAISDPGQELVQEAVEKGFPVIPLPGANAAVTALVASALPTTSFLFSGFLPRGTKEMRAALEGLKTAPQTLLFYESPHRIRRFLSCLLEVLGNRRVTLARELTKRHEEFLRGRVADLVALYTEREPKGEFTVIVEGFTGAEAGPAQEIAWEEAVEEQVERYIREGKKKKEAIQLVAVQRQLPKREVYNRYHAALPPQWQQEDETFSDRE